MLGESAAYGPQNIQSHIDKCFSKVKLYNILNIYELYIIYNIYNILSQSQGCLGVTESEFATWIMQEPPLLIWITTFNRMKSAENSIYILYSKIFNGIF